MQNQTVVVDYLIDSEAIDLSEDTSGFHKVTGRTEWYLINDVPKGITPTDAPRVEAFEQVWIGIEPELDA